MTKIKFNPLLPVLGISFGALCGILFFAYPVPANKDLWWVGPGLILFNLPMLFANYLVISDREVVVNNQFGMVRRRYAINSKNEISVTGNRIYLDKPGKKEEVKYNRFLASKKGLHELKTQLIESQLN